MNVIIRPLTPEVTIKALSFIDHLTPASRIADIGCGSGSQTMVMARHAPWHITGIDLFPVFIELFNSNARKLNLQERVTGKVGSMEELPFQAKELVANERLEAELYQKYKEFYGYVFYIGKKI